MTDPNTISAAVWANLRIRAWRYQVLYGSRNGRLLRAHRPDKAHTN